MTMLNREQQKAVDHIKGPVLVLAGAGAGKTRIVTARIAQLIETGVPAEKILAVTFTNKAAGEMQRRIQQACQQRVLTSTFHSLGARILRESIDVLGRDRNFVIYDEEDSLKLIRTCMKEFNLRTVKPKAIRTVISNAKNRLLEPEDYLDVYQLYQRQLAASNAVDFDDLIFLTVEVLRRCPDYQSRWEYLLIDEFQDTNHAQYMMTRHLAQRHHNLFVVGDPDQSIYSWRGANISHILNFENDYPGTTVIRLEQNYRSTHTILEASNALIEKNVGRYEKNLWSDLGDGEPIRQVRCDNDWEEAEWVAAEIERLYFDGMPLNEMVVFYRTNAQSRHFEDALLRKRIPYVIVGGISFYHRREVKDILSLLRMVEGGDYIAFARTINLPKRGFGDATLEKIRKDGDLLAPNVRLSAKQRQGLDEYRATIEQLRQMKEFLGVHELVQEAIQRSGYLGYLKEDPESFQDRKANLDALIGKAIEWDSLQAFLEELALKSTLDEVATENERVTLMTVHNGKGLEYRAAFLAGMDEGLFPHINSLDDVEEERRLCYVGMTRAKEALYLTSARCRFVWGSKQPMRPSRFLNEIPEEYKEIESSANGNSFAVW